MIKKFYKQLLPEKKRNNIRQGLLHFVSPVYYGNKYTCNCCNKSFRKFLPKGNVPRENARCPNCGSLERTRVLHFYLKNETAIFNQQLKVLHFAPEACLFRILSKLDIEYIDGDINPANATYVIDITNIHYPENHFDLIICSHVLGHVPDEAKAISELKRVLKPGCNALIITLIDPDALKTFEDKTIVSEKERLMSYGEPDLCRLHGRDFAERLQNQGFEVACIDYTQKLPQELVERHRLGDARRELIFKCTKNF